MITDLEDVVSNLIKFKTVKTKIGEIQACIKWIAKEFGEDVSVTHFPHASAPSLLLSPNGVSNPKILLVGHIDVVDVVAESQFIPKIEGDKLYGRGAFDMKGTVAALLLAFRNTVQKSEKGFVPSVGVLITSDEEIGGKEGAERIIREFSLKPEIAIVPDGGNSFEVATGGKGVSWLDITFKTKAAHVSRPWEGLNAIQCMSKVVAVLEEKYPGMQETKTDETTLSPVSVTTDNTSSNVVPDNTFISFNIRYTKDFDFDELRKIVEDLAGVSDVLIQTNIEPYEANLADPLAERFLSIVEKKTGSRPKTDIYPSTCDARFFAALGIPVIVTRPTGGDAHGPNEWIDLKSLSVFQDILEEFIHD